MSKKLAKRALDFFETSAAAPSGSQAGNATGGARGSPAYSAADKFIHKQIAKDTKVTKAKRLDGRRNGRSEQIRKAQLESMLQDEEEKPDYAQQNLRMLEQLASAAKGTSTVMMKKVLKTVKKQSSHAKGNKAKRT